MGDFIKWFLELLGDAVYEDGSTDHLGCIIWWWGC